MSKKDDTEVLALATHDIKAGQICVIRFDIDTGHAWVEPATDTVVSRLLKKVTTRMEKLL